MNSTSGLRLYLNNELELRKAQNPSYSLRAFARHLKMSAGALSDFLNGKRKFSRAMELEIASQLNISLTQLEELSHTESNQINLEEFSLISNWYHFAILSLAETTDYKAEPRWVSKRLGITELDAKNSMKILKKLKYLTAEGSINKSVNIHTPSDIPSKAIKLNHIEGSKLAMDALLQKPVEQREFNGTTIALDKESVSEIKNILRKTVRDIEVAARGKRQTDVYRLNMHFFQLTNEV